MTNQNSQDGSDKNETRLQDDRESTQRQDGTQSSASGQVLTGEQPGADIHSGQPQSGTSALAANTSQADLGASGAGSPQTGTASDSQSAQSGSDQQGGFIGSGSSDSGDYLERDGNPDGGFAEQGQGAAGQASGSGPEGSSERTANRDSDIEGSSRN